LVLSPPQPAHNLADDPPLQHPAAGHTPHGSQPFKIKEPIDSNLLHVGTHRITTNQPSTTNKNPIQTQHHIPPETTTKIHKKKIPNQSKRAFTWHLKRATAPSPSNVHQ
jgi:hypothetical protein